MKRSRDSAFVKATVSWIQDADKGALTGFVSYAGAWVMTQLNKFLSLLPH